MAGNVNNNSAVNSHFAAYNWAYANGTKDFATEKSLPQYQPSNAATAQSDVIELSAEARNAVGSMSSDLRNVLLNSNLNMRSVLVEQGNTSFRAIITPLGIWKESGGNGDSAFRSAELLDTSKGVPGVAQSTIRELEHLSKMLSHIPPEITRIGLIERGYTPQLDFVPNNLEAREHVGTPEFHLNPDRPITLQSQSATLFDRLQQMTNAFAAVREEFGNSNQHIQSSEAAFRHLLNNQMLAAQLARKNLEGESAANMSSADIHQMREEAQRQINAFGDTFLSNFREHGLDGAFEIAWKQLQ
ncbi:MAG: hypothetical protein FWE23_03595 [Chitinivibrionia bacterium]|nr:hypothetical protein [Chitinivibrionia bacterium]